ncbi:MAG: hypothetical protein ABI165_20020, partial [Bryobacteraceae bacterium]
MSSKPKPDPAGASLAARLTWWYAASSFVLILAVTGILYWALARNFDQQSDRYLEEKTAVLRALLHLSATRGLAMNWEIGEEETSHAPIRVLSRVLTGDGRPLYETAGMNSALPGSILAPLRTGAPRFSTDVRSGGSLFRVLETVVAAGNGAPEYRIEVALDTGYQQDFIAHYRHQLWLVLAAGL